MCMWPLHVSVTCVCDVTCVYTFSVYVTCVYVTCVYVFSVYVCV